MIPAELTASEAADLHCDFAAAMKSTTTADELWRGFIGTMHDAEERMPIQGIAQRIDEAETFLVSGEMVQLAHRAAADLDGLPLFVHDLPALNMMVILDDVGLAFPNPRLADDDPIGESCTLRALLIATCDVKYGRDEVDGPGVVVLMLTDVGQMREALDLRRDYHPWGPFLPTDMTGWQFGRAWQSLSEDETRRSEKEDFAEVDGVVTSHIAGLRRFILSLVLLMREEVYRERERVDRPTARRWKAGPVKVPDDYSVAVTRLRRITLPDDSDEDRPPGGWLTHRFFVRGHWRRIHRGTPQERAIWIRPYIKGPEDGTFIQKQRVTVLDR